MLELAKQMVVKIKSKEAIEQFGSIWLGLGSNVRRSTRPAPTTTTEQHSFPKSG